MIGYTRQSIHLFNTLNIQLNLIITLNSNAFYDNTEERTTSTERTMQNKQISVRISSQISPVRLNLCQCQPYLPQSVHPFKNNQMIIRNSLHHLSTYLISELLHICTRSDVGIMTHWIILNKLIEITSQNIITTYDVCTCNDEINTDFYVIVTCKWILL